MASLEFKVREDSMPKISLTILGMSGILEAPPMSSRERFLRCSLENSILGSTLLLMLLKAEAISLKTGMMIFSNS